MADMLSLAGRRRARCRDRRLSLGAIDGEKEATATTPGEVLLEEFLKPLEVSQYQLAKDVGVPPRRINEIVLGKRVVTADTALRLARYFGTSERFWLNIQPDMISKQRRTVWVPVFRRRCGCWPRSSQLLDQTSAYTDPVSHKLRPLSREESSIA
jgi:addiction module HigA family antidote